jgi:hypothetical protein
MHFIDMLRTCGKVCALIYLKKKEYSNKAVGFLDVGCVL